MEKTIPITPFGHEILSARREELLGLVSKNKKLTARKQPEPSGYQNELIEIENILDKSFVRSFDEKNPAQVQIGSVVKVESLSTGDKREYTILSRSTANPLKGIISNESPLAQKMLGLKLGNTFKYRNNYGSEESYKICSIE